MKVRFIVSILILIFSLPVYSSGPGSDWVYKGDSYSKPDWWKGDWPPKNWGDFVSGWNQNAPPGFDFPYHGGGKDKAIPSLMLYQSPPPTPKAADPTPKTTEVKHDPNEQAKSDQQSAKAEEAAKCGSCFKISFSAVPTASLDYDRNRYIIYLGSDEVLDDETISKKTGTMVGPFAVVEYGIFSADIGIKGVVGFGQIGSINIGLKLKGSTGYESSRIATTLNEAKNMKRLKSIPRTFKELMELPIGTIIVSKLSGGIAFEASAVAGYVASASTAFGRMGNGWFV